MQTTDTAKRATKSGSVDTGKPLSHKTVLKYYTILNNLFHCAYLDDVIQVNPMDKVERPRARKDEAPHEVEALSVADAQNLLECLKKEPLQWQAIIGLMLDSGCRRGEAIGLKWKSVHFPTNTITIENNLQYAAGTGLYDTTPKGKKSRTVDIAPTVMVLLKQVKTSQRITTLDGYCFTNRDGKPIKPDTVTRYLKRFGERYGFPGLHPHALRHTAATIAITNGADIPSVSAKLGHAETSTTMNIYTHANQESIKKANDIYRNVLYVKEGQTMLIFILILLLPVYVILLAAMKS